MKWIIIIPLILLYSCCDDDPCCCPTSNSDNDNNSDIEFISGELQLDMQYHYDDYYRVWLDCWVYNEGVDGNIDGGIATVSGFEMTYNDSMYYNNVQFDTTYTFGELPIFGTYSAWGLSGNAENDIPTFYTDMYIPPHFDDVRINGKTDKDTIYTDEDLFLTWIYDISNPLEVYISIKDNSQDKYLKSLKSKKGRVKIFDKNEIKNSMDLGIGLLIDQEKVVIIDNKKFILRASVNGVKEFVVIER